MFFVTRGVSNKVRWWSPCFLISVEKFGGGLEPGVSSSAENKVFILCDAEQVFMPAYTKSKTGVSRLGFKAKK